MKRLFESSGTRWLWGVTIGLIGVVVFGMGWISYLYRDITQLPVIASDEFLFIRTLFKMADAISRHDWVGTFNYTWFNYGFAYFLGTLVITLPGMLTDQWTWIVMAPRMISTLSVAFSLGLIVDLFSRFRRPWVGLWVSLGIVSMPYVWQVGTWFHPDCLMLFWCVCMIWALARDRGQSGRFFWWAVIFLGCAIGTKFQAILVTPILLAYWASYRVDDFKREGYHAGLFRRMGRDACRIVVTLSGIFFVWNPYIVHPMGFKAFKRLLDINLAWGTEVVSIVDRFRFGVMLSYAGPIVIGIVGGAVATSVVIACRRWTDFESRLIGIVGATAVLNILYMVLAVNNGWPHYYLVPVVLMWIAGVYTVFRFHNRIGIGLLVACIGVNLNYGVHMIYTELHRRNTEVARDTYRSARESVTQILAPLVTPGDTVLATTVSIVDFRTLGIGYLDLDAEVKNIQRRYVVQDAHEAYFRARGFSIMPPFRDHTWIVIDKRTPYFKVGLEGGGDLEFYKDARHLISELVAGKWGYSLVYESADVLILRRR